MTKSKVTGFIIWILGLALALFLMFIIPKSISTSIIITAVFTVIAFVSQIILWLVLFKGNVGTDGTFYRTPAMTFSTVYMIIQFIICVLMAFAGNVITTKVALIVNFVVLVLMWILILALNSAKDHAQRIDSRQKNHHVEL